MTTSVAASTASYEERTPWPAWVALLVWASTASATYGLLSERGSGLSPAARWLVLPGALGAGLALRTLLGSLRVRVGADGLFLHLGDVPLLRRSIAFEEIERVEVVRYRPLLEFGGWGIRGWGRKKAWSMRGDRAVRLHLTGDRLLYIGSDVPDRLAERIRTIGGSRIGARGARGS